MRRLIRRFDAALGAQIKHLPKSWYSSLALLCMVISPVTWLVVAAIGTVVSIFAKDNSMSLLSVGVLLLLPLSELIKLVFKRKRPESIYVEETRIKSYSFPSGHAYSTALGSGYLLIATTQLVTGGLLWLIAAALVAITLLVAAARVYLGAHFPSDVIAGLALGAAILSGLALAVGVPLGGLL